MHYLIADSLGQPFSWKTQQDARTVNDILPMKGLENEQLAVASKSHLMWHVEDAFHDARGEFLSLMCLRNHDGIPTLISSPDLTLVSNAALDELFTAQYYVRADDAHIAQHNSNFDDIAEEQRVPVRRRFRDEIRADGGAGAGAA